MITLDVLDHSWEATILNELPKVDGIIRREIFMFWFNA
jgi:hypothetical protein